MYNARIIAEYILQYYHDNGVGIKIDKLNNLLFFIQERYLFEFDTPLFEEELSTCENGFICEDVDSDFYLFYIASDNDLPICDFINIRVIRHKDKKLLNWVLNRYFDYSPEEIVNEANNTSLHKAMKGVVTTKDIMRYTDITGKLF